MVDTVPVAPEPAGPDVIEPTGGPTGGPTSERRIGWLLVAAALTAVVTLGLVLTLGLQRPPELVSLSDDERPEHALAILSYRDDARGQCLDVITPQGEVRELRCSRDGIGSLVAWDERGIMVIRFGSAGDRVDAFDPVTGDSRRLTDVDARTLDERRWALGAAVDRDGGRLAVRDADGTVRWSVRVGDAYRIDTAIEHPTTGDLALIDSAGRLLLLVAGANEPRVWVGDIGSVFGEVVWEGTGPRTD